MAKTEAAPDGATPEKKEGAGKRKKTFKKRGEKRIVHHGPRGPHRYHHGGSGEALAQRAAGSRQR